MSDIITLSSDDEENVRQRKSALVKIKKEDDAKHVVKSKEHTEDEKNLSMFKRFIDFCTEVEVEKRNKSPRTMKIITDKFLFRYKHADPEYTKSDSFVECISAVKKKIDKDPSNLFVHMKLVYDELKTKKKGEELNKRKLSEDQDEGPSKKRLKTEVESPEMKPGEKPVNEKHVRKLEKLFEKRLKTEVESSEMKHTGEKPVNEKHVQKLEKLFQKVYRKVKHLEEKEVDWDEEEDSSYLRLERYKKRLYGIWEMWQKVRGHMDEIKRLKYKRIAFSGTDYPKLNLAIEHHVNKTQAFPDFYDIHKLTTETLNVEGEKKISQEKLRKIASEAFQSIGDQLQKKRVYEFWNSCQTYLPNEPSEDKDISDPADKDKTLADVLMENQRQSKEKLNKVINEFVEKQVEAKLEAEEVPAGEEDEDPKSDDDEEEEEIEEVGEEDLIILTSSSEESGSDVNRKAANGISDKKPWQNGKVLVVIDEVESSSDDEKMDKKKNLSEDENKKTEIKKESKSDWEPKPSCSYAVSSGKLRIKSISELTKKEEDSDNCVIMLSDSEL